MQSDMTIPEGEDCPIAIIGLSFEFPEDATSEDKFWEIISEGRCTSTVFPADRLNIDGFYHPDPSHVGTIGVKGGHFVKEDLGAFDAPFFSITPEEAACLDPQQRRLLEVSYHALENAGIPLEKCAGTKTSVYTGCSTMDYLSILQQDFEAEQRHASMGISASMIANRISWFFNFKGLSLNVDSACSSSMNALHLACQDLRAGSSSMAVVGGVNLVYHPNFMKMMCNFGFLSKDSRCWSFDDRANGYARADGTAAVIIKRLKDALRDGDTIRAVIRNTGANQDGRTLGITQPNPEAQLDLIRKTYAEANIDMAPTRFFEAHGTGTQAGDPIEAEAIGRAFQGYTNNDPLYIGAVKANIGHLEGCSGLAGLIKTVLVLERGLIPPIAGLKSLNHRIDADKLHLHFPKEPITWPNNGLRRACVNSFGFGGANAVAILDDAYHYMKDHGLRGHHQTMATAREYIFTNYDERVASPTNRIRKVRDYCILDTPKLLAFSAFDQQAAKRLIEEYCHYNKQNGKYLESFSYILAARKTILPWRSFLVASGSEISHEEPVKALKNPQAAFVFNGQGTQYAGMGKRLLTVPAFRESLEASSKCLRQMNCPWSLLDVIETASPDLPINQPKYSQILTTCLQIALVDLLQSFGVIPTIVLGHSSGEVAAAYASGGLSRSSAVKVSYYRGIVAGELASRRNDLSMMAVGLSCTAIQPYLDRLQKLTDLHVEIGCVNSPSSVTLSGRKDQLQVLRQWLNEDSIFNRQLRVPIAYHSCNMLTATEPYRQLMGKLGGQSSGIPMISTVTGDVVTVKSLQDPDYWISNMLSTVEFEVAFTRLLGPSTRKSPKRLGRQSDWTLQVNQVVEIGPHGALEGPVKDMLRGFAGTNKPVYIPSLIRKQDEIVAMQTLMGRLYCAGYSVDILSVNGQEDSAGYVIPTNLPKYPFNHRRSYWKESRISRNFRFPTARRHELLGACSLDWNPYMAQWRNILRRSEIPWLEDHLIQGEAVLPAAGMLTMAVEALRQLNMESSLTLVEIKDASFLRPIRFDTNAVEVHFNLSIPSKAIDQDWSEFRLFAIDNGEYAECFHGFIRGTSDERAGHAVSYIPFGGGKLCQEWAEDIADGCLEHVDAYKMSTQTSLEYGPCFKCIEHMAVGQDGKAIADISTSSWRAKQKFPFEQYILHPATLDGLAQLLYASLDQGKCSLPTMVPVRIQRLCLDTSNTTVSTSHIRSAIQCTPNGRRGAIADLVAASTDSNHPFIYIQGLEGAFIDKNTASRDQQVQMRNLCTRLTWKPDIDTMSNEQVFQECIRGRPREAPDTLQIHQCVVMVLMTFIEEALALLDMQPSQSRPQHVEAYIEWMRYHCERLRGRQRPVASADVQGLLQDQKRRENLISQLQGRGGECAMFMSVGQALTTILSCNLDPLEIIFKNGAADLHYEAMLANEYHSHPISAYLDLLSFKDPSMKILEIGAGTGGQTGPALEALTSNGIAKCSRYDFTDISHSFLDKARERFIDHADIMRFRVLNITKDPSSQSFEPGTYDLILASHVLHAVNSVEDALSNVRKLLKPGGKLILVETTHPDTLPIPFVFGLLKGWWSPLQNERRSQHSPCLTSQQWDERLKVAGLSGVEVEIAGQADPQCRYSSIIISTALQQTPKATTEVAIIRDRAVVTQVEFSQTLERYFACNSYTVSELDQADVSSSTTLIFLLEVNDTFLDGISADEFDHLQSIFKKFRSALWVTWDQSGKMKPHHHLIDGLFRTLASEDSTRKLVTMEIDGSENIPHSASHVLSVVRRIATSAVESLETNCTVKDGMVHIPRVAENGDLNESLYQSLVPRSMQICKVKADTPLSLNLRNPGNFDTLEYQDHSVDKTALGEKEILVEVRAFGLTHRDYLAATGQLNDSHIGTECSGVILAAGKRADLKLGDRVCLIGTSTSATIIRTNANAAITIPDHMGFAEAASMPIAALLSYHALVNIARLQENETVLIHHASSIICQIIIQIANMMGAEVLAMTASLSEAKFLQTAFGISEKSILLCDSFSAASQVNNVTNGRGVDLFIGSFTDRDQDLYQTVAPFGRIIDIGLNGSSNSPGLPARLNVSHSSLDTVEMLKRKPKMAHKTFRDAMKMIFEGQIKPPQPLHTFPINETNAAFQHFQTSGEIGKRVVEVTPGTIVEANLSNRPTYTFSPDVTYVISGGLGGFGRTIARWMASRGARNLILLSRSGVKRDQAKALVDELNGRGVQVATPMVDIGDFSGLSNALHECLESMPPVKGCIQAAMSLRDALFEKITYEDWQISTRPKVAGSWNLHNALPSGLDFFILLSSINGIFGGSAQANYAAGNTFEDALTHYRIDSGQKAVSIDMGIILADGLLADNEVLMASMRRLGHVMEVTREESLGLLEHYCNPNLPLLSHPDSQVLVGIELPSDVLAKGIELHHSIYRPIFRHLFRMNRKASEQHRTDAVIVDRATALQNASPDEARDLVTQWFTSKVRQILGLSEDLDISRPVHSYGIDSMVANDLRNWFQKEIGADVTVFELLGNMPLEKLSAVAAEKSLHRQVQPVEKQ